MFAIFPLVLLAVILVTAMPWHRPHPNHLFFLELLQYHLPHELVPHEPATGGDSAEPSKGGTIAVP
jgi:hypothetical protein